MCSKPVEKSLLKSMGLGLLIIILESSANMFGLNLLFIYYWQSTFRTANNIECVWKITPSSS